MAIEFNGKKNLSEVKIGKEMPSAKDVEKKENVEQQPQVDNRFVKELGEELLASAAVYNVPIRKAGTRIDHEFWGDALKGLNLKDTALAEETTVRIAEMDNAFAIMNMEQKMKNSPFMQALNREFGIE